MSRCLSRRAFFGAVAAAAATPAAISLWTGRRAHAATTREAALAQWNKGGYSYCDAQVLAHFWRQPVRDAKVRAGRLMAERKWSDLKAYQHKARAQALPRAHRICPYHESGFAYADMKTLAGLWDTSMDATKLKVSRRLVDGDQWSIRKALKAAARPRPSPPLPPRRR